MENKLKKVVRVVEKNVCGVLFYLNTRTYMKVYVNLLATNLLPFLFFFPLYIHKSAYFDGSDYGLIEIGEGVTISANVTLLTHDFSRNTVYPNLGCCNEKKLDEYNRRDGIRVLRAIKIGDNCFIGMGAMIMPGAKIGNNVLIGAGCVVRGSIPDGTIVIGNPCQIVGNTKEWLEKYDGEKIRREP